ncbi:GntR family transcriptional regulator [Mesorhizobium sp. M7D.F.Ca.US.004.03.1.1]|uniref:GntR family transcriptional regulator n=1 Tax=Mesorhizobium sp. M7D.F.Ca.US.004.03.1.1 TaxID=2496702 RepID=UPI0032AF60FF
MSRRSALSPWFTKPASDPNCIRHLFLRRSCQKCPTGIPSLLSTTPYSEALHKCRAQGEKVLAGRHFFGGSCLMIDQKSPGPRNSQTNLGYTRLLQMILDAKLQRGVVLNERRLASLVGVSRTPLRVAIGRLLSDGLLIRSPSGVMTLDGIDLQRFAEILALRRILEVDAAVLAAGRADESRIRGAEAALEAASSRNPLSGYEAWQADESFHHFIDEMAGNRFATSLMADFRLLSHALSGGELGRRIERAHSEHKAILSAVRNGGPQAARKAMDEHLAAERDTVMDAVFGR